MSATDGTIIDIMDAMAALEGADAGLVAAGLKKAYDHKVPNVISLFPFSCRWLSEQGATYAPEGGGDTLKGGEYGSEVAGVTTTTYHIDVFVGVCPVVPDWTTLVDKALPFERVFKNAYLRHRNIGRTCQSSRVDQGRPYVLKIGDQAWFGLLFAVRAHTEEDTVIMAND